MNIKILLSLILIIIVISYYESIEIKKSVYNDIYLKKLRDIDKKLDIIASKKDYFKLFEFSLKMSENKVGDTRYLYGILSKNKKVEVTDEDLSYLDLDNDFLKIINKYKKKFKCKNVTIGVSQDVGNSLDRIYIEPYLENKMRSREGDPKYVSYEREGGKINTRYYNSKEINKYLGDRFKNSGTFGHILNDYFPDYKIRPIGFKYVTTKDKKVDSYRFYPHEYNSILDLKNMILDLAVYFKMNNSNMIKIKRWIENFKEYKADVIGVTLYPTYNITFYSREVTQYV